MSVALDVDAFPVGVAVAGLVLGCDVESMTQLPVFRILEACS